MKIHNVTSLYKHIYNIADNNFLFYGIQEDVHDFYVFRVYNNHDLVVVEKVDIDKYKIAEKLVSKDILSRDIRDSILKNYINYQDGIINNDLLKIIMDYEIYFSEGVNDEIEVNNYESALNVVSDGAYEIIEISV